MDGGKRKEYTMKKRVFAIVPTVILCILLFYLIKTSQSPKSPYQNLTPVSGFSIQAVQAQYTIDTKQISLCITNHSDNSPELYLPYLEQNINETWVIVKKSPHIRDTDICPSLRIRSQKRSKCSTARRPPEPPERKLYG